MTETQIRNCVKGIEAFVKCISKEMSAYFNPEENAFVITDEYIYKEYGFAESGIVMKIEVREDEQDFVLWIDCNNFVSFNNFHHWNMNTENILTITNIISEILFGYTYERVYIRKENK